MDAVAKASGNVRRTMSPSKEVFYFSRCQLAVDFRRNILRRFDQFEPFEAENVANGPAESFCFIHAEAVAGHNRIDDQQLHVRIDQLQDGSDRLGWWPFLRGWRHEMLDEVDEFF